MEVVRVDVVSPRTSLQVNETVQLAATPRNADGDGMTARGVTWSSSSPGVADVSASGVVTGRAAGNARITARSGNASGSVDLTILRPPCIGLSGSSVALNGLAGATTPVTSTVSVSNCGDGALTGLTAAVQYVTGSNWLQATLNSASAPATLTLQASLQALPAGQYDAVVTIASSVAPSATVNVRLTVAEPPSIQLSVTPATLTLQAGTGGSVSVGVNRRGGFTGAVTVTPTNLPAGVTAAPVVIPVGATSGTLAIAAAGNAVAGTTTVTLRGSASGVADHTTTFNLTITEPPGYTLSVTPASVSVTQGTSAQATVSIARGGGFAGVVNLTASGNPAGMTLSFNPAAASGTQSLLTINVAGSTAPGSYPIVVRGTATGFADRLVTLNVQVGSGLLVVTTGTADSVTVNTAKFRGSVGNNGTPYTIWFEWGTSPTLVPYTTTGSAPGPGSSCAAAPACEWELRMQGLLAGTTYYFRIVAQNASGVSRGAIRSFTTLSPPTAPVISNPAYTWELNSALCTTQYPHLLRLSFGFQDVNGNVAFTGTPVQQTWLFQPSGATGTDALAVDSYIGTGSSGTIRVAPFCWTYGGDTSLQVTLSLRDATGLTSNALVVNLPRPAGAGPDASLAGVAGGSTGGGGVRPKR